MTSVELYTLQIISDHPLEKLDATRTHAAVAECEENLTLLLQDGYRAVIRPWDYPDDEDELADQQDEQWHGGDDADYRTNEEGTQDA